MRKLVFAIAMLTLRSLSVAATPNAPSVNKTQQEAVALLEQKRAAQAVPHSQFATSSCAFTFVSGAADSFLKYCVTANGNITQLETPAGKEHIAVGAAGEGYGICDLIPFVQYDDYADFGDTGNWAQASLLDQTATSVKIARTTTDGIWTFTQTITQVAGTSPSVKVTMTLRNNTSDFRTVFLERYADVDAGGAVLNSLDGTAKSAFGWNTNAGSNPFGLILQNAGHFPVATEPAGFTQTVANGPDACNFTTNFATGTQIATDGSIVLLYGLNIPAHKSQTVIVSYKGL